MMNYGTAFWRKKVVKDAGEEALNRLRIVAYIIALNQNICYII